MSNELVIRNMTRSEVDELVAGLRAKVGIPAFTMPSCSGPRILQPSSRRNLTAS